MEKRMNEEGPILESLTRRLAECPREFLLEPISGNAGEVKTAAVVFDLIQELGGSPLSAKNISAFNPLTGASKSERNRLRIVLVACWLLFDSWFRSQKRFAELVLKLLLHDLKDFSDIIQVQQIVDDPDRREEFVRICLRKLDLRPRGETIAQAEDRLTTLDSVERVKVVREARAAEERAKKVREEIERKRAAEAAASYSRE